MMSKFQLGYLHQALKQTGMADAQWRIVLRNTGKLKGDKPSSKDLDNAGFERVMAVLEESGFRDTKKPGDYWRTKAANAGRFASPAAVRFLIRLAETSRYSLPSLCERFSQGRTAVPEKLTPGEAYKLTEMLKNANQRELTRNAAGDYQRPAPQPDLFDKRAYAPPPPKPAAVPCAVEDDEPPF